VPQTKKGAVLPRNEGLQELCQALDGGLPGCARQTDRQTVEGISVDSRLAAALVDVHPHSRTRAGRRLATCCRDVPSGGRPGRPAGGAGTRAARRERGLCAMPQLWGLCLEMVDLSGYNDAGYVRQLWDAYLKQGADGASVTRPPADARQLREAQLAAACGRAEELGSQFFPNEARRVPRRGCCFGVLGGFGGGGGRACDAPRGLCPAAFAVRCSLPRKPPWPVHGAHAPWQRERVALRVPSGRLWF
jgi:hypothetical protein